MAYTRIHAIKATVQKALKYICNPQKTDGQILIDSFACGVETAHYDFMDALSKSSGVGDKQAFHLIQSFAPGEVDFDMAHQIGIELADKLLENKYSYVIATHIDKEHCHNHIIFCAVDNVEHKKYNDCKRTYRRIRNLSDELCREHGLSVIIPSGQKGKTQIILFGGAENMLKRYGIKTASLDVEKMQAEYDAMAAQKAKLKKTYQTAEKEAAEAGKQLKNIRQYLGGEKDGHRETKQHRKQDVSL
jgi:outer membrane murein-binding lipoprotein Lpp